MMEKENKIKQNFRLAYQWLKNIYHYLQSRWQQAINGWPDKGLCLYGITGTNGKTTTAIILGSILRAAYGADKVGLLSTEIFWLGKLEQPNKTHMTTIDSVLLWRLLRQMKEQGVKHVVLEITSHALHQHRLAGLKLSGAIITNITREHLDYHLTMAAYTQAKMKIAGYLRRGSPLVLNQDDKWTKKGWQMIGKHKDNISVVWFSRQQAGKINTLLPGDFNKENVLAAGKLAEVIRINRSAIHQGVASVAAVPGRMEWVELRSGARALVDFALTPDALERLYSFLRPQVSGRLIAVFGAAGNRDQGKRPLITKIVAKYADEIVLTQDEPYDEAEENIYQQLESGLTGLLTSDTRTGFSWRRIPDRLAAISYALQQARLGDGVIVTGMGNYNSRAVGDKKIPWHDRAVIEKLNNEI